MELAFTAEEEQFREQVRAWLGEAMPPAIAERARVDGDFSHDEVMEWHRILYRKGWVAPHWPAKYGGAGLDVTRRFILAEELEESGAPGLSPFGLVMVGPLLMEFGSDAQKERFLPKILSGEEVWCQGYSEPNAGSDLASLRTSAVANERGEYVVNGQKTWTTHAQHADWIFCLVRTESRGRKQEGISFLLIDMKSPGVDARPMLTLGGKPGFCETFFENVVVPKENLVGPEHGGWTVAKALLGHERTAIAAISTSRRMLRRAKRIAAETRQGEGALLSDPAFRARIARVELDLRALAMTNYRTLAASRGDRAPGPESSILKIRGTELLQRVYELCMELMGPNAMSWFNPDGTVPATEQAIASAFCYSRAATIYGGSNEIQRNIIAKRILGLS